MEIYSSSIPKMRFEEDFIKLFGKLSPKIGGAKIFNTDQVGIEKEQHSTRTLSFQGERKTFGVVESNNAITHSYKWENELRRIYVNSVM